jgi:hypothetical protein
MVPLAKPPPCTGFFASLQRMAEIGASYPLRIAPAEVHRPIKQRPLSRGGQNCSSCPKADPASEHPGSAESRGQPTFTGGVANSTGARKAR